MSKKTWKKKNNDMNFYFSKMITIDLLIININWVYLINIFNNNNPFKYVQLQWSWTTPLQISQSQLAILSCWLASNSGQCTFASWPNKKMQSLQKLSFWPTITQTVKAKKWVLVLPEYQSSHHAAPRNWCSAVTLMVR